MDYAPASARMEALLICANVIRHLRRGEGVNRETYCVVCTL